MQIMKAISNVKQASISQITRIKKLPQKCILAPYFWFGYITSSLSLNAPNDDIEITLEGCQKLLNGLIQVINAICQWSKNKQEIISSIVNSIYADRGKINQPMKISFQTIILQLKDNIKKYYRTVQQFHRNNNKISPPKADNNYDQTKNIQKNENYLLNQKIYQQSINNNQELASSFNNTCQYRNQRNNFNKSSPKCFNPEENQHQQNGNCSFGQLTQIPRNIHNEQVNMERQQQNMSICKNRISPKKIQLGNQESLICCTKSKPSTVITFPCKHQIHKACFVKYFQQKVRTKKFPIECKQQGCNQQILIETVQQYIPIQKLREYVSKNKQYVRWCPTADCNTIFTLKNNPQKYKCLKCKKLYCIRCGLEYHLNVTCEANKSKIKKFEDQKKFIRQLQKKQNNSPYVNQHAKKIGDRTSRNSSNKFGNIKPKYHNRSHSSDISNTQIQ